MSNILMGIIAVLASGLAWEWGRRTAAKNARDQVETAKTESARLSIQLSTVEARKQELEDETRQLRDSNATLNREVSRLESEASALIQRLEEQKQHLVEVQKTLTDRFEVLAHQIFEQNSTRLMSQSEKNLVAILDPLREKIREFEKRVEESYGNEAKERFALHKEIQRLMELNVQMGAEAASLTRALKGDVKLQGTWGEMVLERILETSGLRSGFEYTRQGQGLSLTDDDGGALKPDIVIHLPEEKHIIIDSKVSLVAYERMCRCLGDDERVAHLKDHVDSLLNHIKGLGDKHYHSVKQIRSPDFVLLFMPIEGAFSAAIQGREDLFQCAWERRIVLVSPTTLLATLRTVASIWKHEKQSKNAVEIARQGGALYDEFVRFSEDLTGIGAALDNARKAYDSSVKRLSFGKGNLVSRVERLRELGAKAKREIELDTDSSLSAL